ncbi:hypothetical protein STEG23_014936 [Scotinomys teguina]
MTGKVTHTHLVEAEFATIVSHRHPLCTLPDIIIRNLLEEEGAPQQKIEQVSWTFSSQLSSPTVPLMPDSDGSGEAADPATQRSEGAELVFQVNSKPSRHKPGALKRSPDQNPKTVGPKAIRVSPEQGYKP